MSGSVAISAASASGSSFGSSHTPTSLRADNAACSALHRANGTMTGTLLGTSASEVASRSSVQRSSIMDRSLMSSGINAFLEGFDAEPAHRVDESLVFVTALDINVDERCDDVGHFGGSKRGADNLPQRGTVALCAADRDLVPLLAVLIDAEDADVADVMMSAGIHAARHVELDVSDVVQIIEVVEPALDRFGDGNGFGIGQRA